MSKELELKELATEFAKATDDVKAIAEEVKGRMEKGESNIASVAEKADEALIKFNELKASIEEIEQKQARRGESPEHSKSLGRQLFESEQFKALASDPTGKGKASLQIKATLTSATTDADGSAGALIAPDRLSGIIAPPQQRLTIRDLIMAGTTQSNAIEYTRETGFTNNAGPQENEGDLKAQSTLKFDDVTVSVRTLAHWIDASRQVLEDASQLESHVNGRLMYGLKLKEDLQLLNGDNTGGNLHGIIPQATDFADPASMAKYTIIDQLRLAMLQAVLAEYPASGHVLNPIDWAKIELQKDGQGRHIIGVPQGNAPSSLWRAPVVETKSMGVGKFLTGAFDLGAQIFDREQSSIAVSTEHNDNFTRNKVTILCEERLALAVYRPEAFVYGDLAAKV